MEIKALPRRRRDSFKISYAPSSETRGDFIKAIILAAGYATRLYPLTLNTPKALLPIRGKPIIEYIMDQIKTIKAIDEVFVVSNHKFVGAFENWLSNRAPDLAVRVLDDGTTSENDRKGAIGDISFVIDEMKIDDDTVILAGDNYFTFSLENYYNYFMEKNCDCVCVKKIADREELKRLGVAVLDETGRVIRMVEKPADPPSDCAVFAIYLYKKETLALVGTYLQSGNKPDAPGNFVRWLCERKPVHAFLMDGECYDIGTPQAYEQAQNL